MFKPIVFTANLFARQTVLTLLVLCGSVLCHAATIDATLYTTYTTFSNKTTLDYSVCGSLPDSSGCYASGSLGPFGQIGSIVEGSKSYNVSKGTVTRYLYVVDQAYGTAQDGVALYAYKRVDTITSSTETTTFTLEKTLSLSLTGGASALTFVGANSGYLVIGTNLTAVPVEVAKKNYAVTSLGIIDQVPISITADNYGYITVTSAGGFFVVGPTGSEEEDGGGSPFMVNTLLGVQP
jgi:hypothetical protein